MKRKFSIGKTGSILIILFSFFFAFSAPQISARPTLGSIGASAMRAPDKNVQPVTDGKSAPAQIPSISQWVSQYPLGQTANSYLGVLWCINNLHYRELTAEDIKKMRKIQKRAINDILALLDRYSHYHSPEEMEMINSGGYFVGVGVRIGPANMEAKTKQYRAMLKNAAPLLKDKDFEDPKSVQAIEVIARLLSTRDPQFAALYREQNKGILSSDGLEIVTVIPGGPAAKIGMDKYIHWRIIGVEGKPISGITIKEVIRRIKGPVGTKVVLELRSPDGLNTVSIQVERGEVDGCQMESRMLTPEIGYIKFSNFDMRDKNGTFTADPIIGAVKDLKKRHGMKKLVLDLRGNPGGFIQEAHQILSAFLPDKTLEVYLKHRGRRGNELYASSTAKFLSLPLVILVDEHSASASELTSISLRDYHRATIIGTKTFGKGTAQQILPLPDGSGLRLTVDHYFSPVSNICIDGIGVTPDIEAKDDPQTPKDEVIEKAIDFLSKK